jgi:hypothetical protein
MSMARDLIAGQSPPAVDSDNRLTTWYAQGHSDGLGDRLLMFDNTSGPPWEILRFKPTLARDSRFEAALHERVKHLSSFRHPAFPRVRPITALGQEDGLAVVSTYVSGVSLSQALTKPRSVAFAAVLIRHLAPALTALQQHGPGIAHGALSADRIILTAEGQPMIREHMVGSALASLELPPGRLWADFGILASLAPETKPTLDCRSDVIQLALVGLSLMAGRRIGPDEYPDKVPQLLDQIAQRASRNAPEFFQSLRHWLERALQLADDPFRSAREANDALEELWEEPAHGDDPRDAPSPPALIVPSDPHAAGAVDIEVESSNHQVPGVRPRLARAMRWVALAAGVLAAGEAVFIGRLLYQRRATVPSVNAQAAFDSPPLDGRARANDVPSQETPLVNAGPGTLGNRVLPSPVARTTAPVTPAPTELGEIAAASQRRGGFRLSSSVEVHVLDGERLLGSSQDGPIVVAPGRHELEFVNSAIGYRMRRVIDVKPGLISPLTITVPNGIVNINAIPWAEVWIDGKPFGETPLGNLSIAPGEHEIAFRHPELGERRQKAFVRTDVPTRVSTNLQQPQ